MVPSHLAVNIEPPATAASAVKTKGDLEVVLGEWVSYGRLQYARFGELLGSVVSQNAANQKINGSPPKP